MSKVSGLLWVWLSLLMSTGCAVGPSVTAGEIIAASEVVHENVTVVSQDGRAVDVRVFYKAGGCDQCSLIMFSHGANATYDRYDVLLKAWAREGYVVAAPLHVDSEAHPRRSEYDRDAHLPTRVEDVSATIEHLLADQLASIEGVSFAGDYMAAGHSFGALIAQIAGGASVMDHSIRAAQGPKVVIAISPPGAVPGIVDPSDWASIEAPMLVVTGTNDIVPFIAPKWEDHLASFEAAPARLSTAIVFDEIDHYFNGAFGRIDDGRAAVDAVADLNAAIITFIRQAGDGVSVADMSLLGDGATGVRILTRENHD